MASIELKNVCKKFGDEIAVNRVSLKIANGEFMVLVGPSGCGKSTLLRMISGLETIDEGAIYIDGEKVNNVPPKDRDIAMVFQNYALYPHMTVYENLAFGLKLRKKKKPDIDKSVKKTAEMLGISQLLQRKPKQLSGGQKQRIAVGRAIIRNPKAFLFDEPLSNLDAKLRVKMRAELLNLHNKHAATSIYVTHDQVEAMTMADRIAIINKGVIQQIDTPEQVYKKPLNKFVAGFIGSPSMNFISGFIRYEQNMQFFETKNNSVDLFLRHPGDLHQISPPSGPCILGIRPEDLYINKKSNTDLNFGEFEIQFIENLGSESILHMSKNKDLILVVKIETDGSHKIGDKVYAFGNSKRVHLFDQETGQNFLASPKQAHNA